MYLSDFTWFWFGCYKHPDRCPLQIQRDMLKLECLEISRSVKVTLLKYILHVGKKKSFTHLAVGQPSEGSFCLGRLKELNDCSESRGRQQHSAQRTVR